MMDKQITIKNLRCEYLENPVGLDETKPRLSWIIESSQRGQAQTAYQLLVASSQALLNNEQGNLWDSGVVRSDQSAHVLYEGRDLQSRLSCFWKVRVWDRDGRVTDWSEPATWTMGLLEPEDWQATWIGLDGGDEPVSDQSPDSRRSLPARYLRREFISPALAVEKATAYICGLGYYQLFLNGERVGDHELDPILRDYDKQVPYVTYDVTELVKEEGNALGVILGNGRYYAPHLTVPAPTRTFGYPKLLLQLEIDYADGSRKIVVSDDDWTITDEGPIRNNNDYDGEAYDARKEMPGWNLAGFEASGWQKVERVTAPAGRLTSAACMPAMGVTGVLSPIALTQPQEGVWVFDMGQNMVGRCRLHVSGPAGTQVTMRFAENIYPDGTLDVSNLRAARCTNTYILKGGGEETYTPAFTYQGFRYVELNDYPGEPTLESITGEVINTDLPFAGDFKCSNETINQIVKNARWGIRGNYLSVPTDCPQRDERQGWQGDRAAEQKGEVFLFDNITLYEKWMGDIRDSQRPDGNVSDVCPNYWSFYNSNVTWPSSFIIIPGNLYEQYGDPRAIEQNYQAMKKWMAHIRGFVKGGIIDRDNYGDWCVPPENETLIHTEQPWRMTPKDLLATSYYYHNLKLLAIYAALQGKTDEAQDFIYESEVIREAFNRELFDNEQGCYGNGSQTSQVLALRFGLAPDHRHPEVFDYLVKHIETITDNHIGTGLIGGQWLMRTLSDNGRIDLAYKLATQRDYPSWGYMIENGATTLWELWNGNTADPAMNSGNHVMLLGDLLIWFFEYLGGIKADIDNPGYKHIILNPQVVGDLSHVRAEYNAIYGHIVSEWKTENDRFHWNIVIPANTTATVHIPAKHADTVFESGQPVADVDGVTFVRMADGRALYSISAGNYIFDSEF